MKSIGLRLFMMLLGDKLQGVKILIDAREFVQGRFTGIARVLEGLTDAISAHPFTETIVLATYSADLIPSQLRSKNIIEIKEIPKSFFSAEKCLSDLSKTTRIFISPYPKLPLFGVHCQAIHIIHDILDITHPLYRRRLKVLFDRYRLRKALHRADVTWYDSSWSMIETQKHFRLCGRNPRVRYPGIHEAFKPNKQPEEDAILAKYRLTAGYVLALGNGMPHKNLGVLLEIFDKVKRPLVFAGVSDDNQRYWKSNYPRTNPLWIRHVDEHHLSTILRGAFCLVQPSTAEGYGYPPLEAMACGVPVIVSDIPVLIETTGGNAFTAGPHDSRSWAEALRSLEDRQLYEAQVHKGLKWVAPLQGRKAWQDHVSDFKDLFEKRSS